MSRQWTDTFTPKNWGEFVGNSEAVKRVNAWASEWNSGKKPKPLLIHGKPGNGKTTLALLVAKLNNWGVFELNASDFRTKDTIEKFAGAASQGSSFSGKLRLILLDEVDGLQRADRGGAGAISKILKESKNPVILTANDIYADQKLAPIRAQAELIQLKKINYLSIAKRLRELLDLEGIEFEKDAVEALAKNSGGDFRSALLDTQTLALKGSISMADVESMGYREREDNIFNTMKSLFRAKTVSEARTARWQSEVDDSLLIRWVEENIPIEFDATDTARAFDFFSKGDIFEGRIFNRQHYGFRRYSYDLMTTCALLSREKDYHGWTRYQFPQLLRKLSSSKPARALRKSISLKIGKRINSSARAVMKYELPLFSQLFEDKEAAIRLTAQFDFDEKEVAFLMNTKPETKKVQKIMEEATKLREKFIAQKQGKTIKQVKEQKPEKSAEKKEKPKPEEGQATLSTTKAKPKQKNKKQASEQGKQTTLFG